MKTGAYRALLFVAIAGVAAMHLASAQENAGQRPAAPGTAAALVQAAAQGLGGVDRIRAVKNITLNGYGQYAYMFGGGRISGSPDAPEKYIAANELQRVYDLEHERFLQVERRNDLFPFLNVGGHAFNKVTTVLDGDIAYDVFPDRTVRVARWMEGALMVDGVHQRRMLSLNNPIALVRALLDPATKLSTPRQENARAVIDATLKQGDKLSVAFGADRLPAWVRWGNPHPNLGQVNFTTHFTAYSDVGGGMKLPLGYSTRLDWRNVDYFKMYVDAYQLDTAIADLAAPAAVRDAPEPPVRPLPTLTSVPIAKGIWRISNGTTVVEFKDHLTLYELGMNSRIAKAVLDYARNLAPGKPITQLITSHNHFDHTAGLREAVSEGITIIQRPNSESQFREMAAHAAPDFPDDLAKNPKPLKFMPVEDHLRLQDETQTLDVYWGRNNGHMADVVFAYSPSAKVIMEGDMVTAAFDWQHWPDTFRDSIAYYKLDVERVSPVHSVWREHPDILTRAQAEELLQGGTTRAKEHCQAELAKGVYHPGCPIQSKYY